MTDPPIVWRLPTRHVGRRVLVYDRLGSTNDRTAELAADPANDGVAVLAREQTTGRGQYGRSWLSPPGTCVALSVLLFPPPELRRPVLLTAWAAVAVGEAVRRVTGLQARIKWPNDLLLRGRKVCGILIEQGRGTVVGIGLNVNQLPQHFAEAGLPEAASLASVAGRLFDCDAVARHLIEQLDVEYALLRQGERSALESVWKWRIGLLGRPVAVEGTDGVVYRGRLRELGFDGLVLEQPDGSVIGLGPERARQLRATDQLTDSQRPLTPDSRAGR